MTLATTIQDRTNDGLTIVDFLFAVMRDELTDFKPCHRLDAARLLVKYDLDEARNFITDNPPEPPRPRLDYRSSDETYFDEKLARVIRESTEDGRTVCRFLVNVMEGTLSTFKPHHRLSAARELLSRGFGKHARQEASFMQRPPLPAGEGWGEGESQKHQPPTSHASQPGTQPTESDKSPNHTNQSNVTPYSDTGSDNEAEIPYDEINKIIDDAIEESDRIMAEQGIDPDNPPYKRDLSAYNEAWENSQKWFEEWKNSIDPEEYEAVINEKATEFDAQLETRLERRKQIAAEREQREKEEADRQAQQKEAEAKAELEEPEEPGPPTRSQHKPKLLFTLGNSMYIDCGHPGCDLHDEDRNKWKGSVQYGAGPTRGGFP